MPAAIRAALDGRAADSANQERLFPEGEGTKEEGPLPACFFRETPESRKNFPHTKQVGHYLVGRMINKGSFAKVMEGLHLPTGEKVN